MRAARIAELKRARSLRALPLFTSCSIAELRKVITVTTELDIEAGDHLTVQGEPAREVFVIVSGMASVWRHGVQIDTLGPGAIFGELALIDDGPRTATVVADFDMRVLVLSRQEFHTLQYFVPSVAERLLAVTAVRLRRALERADTFLRLPLAFDTSPGSWEAPVA
jgi:CRP-like cAMP-binding protein